MRRKFVCLFVIPLWCLLVAQSWHLRPWALGTCAFMVPSTSPHGQSEGVELPGNGVELPLGNRVDLPIIGWELC